MDPVNKEQPVQTNTPSQEANPNQVVNEPQEAVNAGFITRAREAGKDVLAMYKAPVNGNQDPKNDPTIHQQLPR